MGKNKDFPYFALHEASYVLGELGSGENGLEEKEAKLRLEKFGPNEIKINEVSWWQILFRQFKSPFVYLLILAFLLSYSLGHKIDAFMIIGFVLINTFLGFYQEFRSERTVKLLKKYITSKSKVIRSGEKMSVDVNKIAVGDILVLEPGDIVPADVRFIETNNLEVDESVLTGESAPIFKQIEAVKSRNVGVHGAKNIGFSGTTVVSGRATGVVFATGKNSNYAKIVTLTNIATRESAFEKELSKFSKFTLGVVIIVLILVMVTSLSIKANPSLTELIFFSIALSVSVVPEALPVVTTFSLSLGALRLAKKNVIVKRLSSIEDLGGLQVLASDKTGTLTENKLEVDEVFSDKPKKTLLYSFLSSSTFRDSKKQRNNAFDLAIEEAISKKDRKKFSSYETITEIPFDPVRKRTSSLVKGKRKAFLISRGAPEEILKICSVNKRLKKRLIKWATEKGESGARVLCVSCREGVDKDDDISKKETKMKYLGMVSFLDPIKPSSYKAVEKAKVLGVRVKILTGDSVEVAGDVATQIGLIESSSEVISGEKFGRMDSKKKREAVDKYDVFARVTPQQKYQIIELLQKKYSVGFLGDGINDAPALKISNVAIVVQGAADVAKEAADVVLLKKDLNVILEGIESGRKVFENTSKYITATMTSNFGNFFAVAFVSIFIEFLPMLPLQILLLNLLSDFPMIFIATDSVDEESLSLPRSYDLKSFAKIAIILGIVSTLFDFLYFAKFFPQGAKVLQTSWFMGSVLTEILFIFSIRTRKFIFKSNFPSKSLLLLTISAFCLAIIIPYSFLGDKLFGFIAPSGHNLFLIITIALAYFVLTEIVKNLYYRYLVNIKLPFSAPRLL